MDVEEALVIVNVVLTAQKQQYLSDVQELVLRQTWSEQSYPEIAQGSGYDTECRNGHGSNL